MEKASPPYYAEEPPRYVPDTGPATQYTIGEKAISEPLVTTTQLRGHLALLDVFTRLKEEVDNIPPPYTRSEVRDGHDAVETQWVLFVSFAVERFERWVVGIQDVAIADVMQSLPPLDVMMVWYTYLLSPCWFREDAMRIPEIAKLKRMSTVFEELLNDPERPYLLLQPPSEERQTLWHETTRIPFSYITCFQTLNTRSILCPVCRAPVNVALHNAQGTGYFQKGFKGLCRNVDGHRAGFPTDITRESLRCRKFAETVTSSGTSHRVNLSGTVFYPRERMHDDTKKRGDKIKKFMLTTARGHISAASRKKANVSKAPADYVVDEDLCQAVMEVMWFRFDSIRRLESDALRILRILNAYHEERIFSVDLSSAVLRQWTFIEELQRFHWTEAGRFEINQKELIHALSRYHGYLHLKSLYPDDELTPTIDIDLVWHTHIVFSDKYYADNIAFLRQIFDHEDAVEAAELARRFDFTARVWKENFGFQYSDCGCPEPPKKLSQKGASFLSQLSRSKKPQSVQPPTVVILQPSSSAEKASTHPSNHNGAHLWHPHDTDVFSNDLSFYHSLEKEWKKRAEKKSINQSSATASSEGAHVFPFAIKLPLKTNYTADRLQADKVLVDRLTPLRPVGGAKASRLDVQLYEQSESHDGFF